MTEYSLNDFLSDPITRQLMKRDGVDEQELRDLAERVRPHAETLRPEEPRSFDCR